LFFGQHLAIISAQTSLELTSLQPLSPKKIQAYTPPPGFGNKFNKSCQVLCMKNFKILLRRSKKGLNKIEEMTYL
jgi:hypothetical protein